MVQHKKSERGQALILIVLAIIGMIGITGLTIDGGRAYSDRRHAQNAADNAAYAAGRSMIREEDWESAAFSLAASNGYDNDGTTNIVELFYPPSSGTYSCAESPDVCDEYIQVVITSNVGTTFGRVLGITQMTNRVDAVSHVVPRTRVHMFDGNAVVGLDPHGCKAVKYDGNVGTTIIGGGIFVNSDCDDTTGAFFSQSGSANLDAPSLCSVGTINNNGAYTGPSSNDCDPYDYPVPDYIMPLPDCGGNAEINGNTMEPGYYNGTFPPSGVTFLEAGVYCIDGRFKMTNSDSLTGSDVVIYMIDGDVDWQGGYLELDAPNEGPFSGLLLYMPYENDSGIVNNGNIEIHLTGTILAPASDIQVNGTSGSEINGQIIGYTIDISGTSGMTITYEDEFNYEAETPPALQLSE
jgi:Flp pilus assembly protein TadG